MLAKHGGGGEFDGGRGTVAASVSCATMASNAGKSPKTRRTSRIIAARLKRVAMA